MKIVLIFFMERGGMYEEVKEVKLVKQHMFHVIDPECIATTTIAYSRASSSCYISITSGRPHNTYTYINK